MMPIASSLTISQRCLRWNCFKVAGTTQGITAIQMDNKIGSLPPEVMEQAFEQARVGRLHILEEMALTLAQPRPQLKPQTPGRG